MFEPTDEQAEALWAATGVVNLPEARRMTDAELGHAVAEGAAFRSIIRAAQLAAVDHVREVILGTDTGEWARRATGSWITYPALMDHIDNAASTYKEAADV